MADGTHQTMRCDFDGLGIGDVQFLSKIEGGIAESGAR